MKVERKGTITITTIENKVNLLSNVQFDPQLAHNLLSVGHLVAGGYSVTFEDDACLISDKGFG